VIARSADDQRFVAGLGAALGFFAAFVAVGFFGAAGFFAAGFFAAATRPAVTSAARCLAMRPTR
jgi:hypothetical protein